MNINQFQLKLLEKQHIYDIQCGIHCSWNLGAACEESSLVIIQIFIFRSIFCSFLPPSTWINCISFHLKSHDGVCNAHCALACKQFVNKIDSPSLARPIRLEQINLHSFLFFGNILRTCTWAMPKRMNKQQENNPITILRNIRLYWFARSILPTEWT